ncbi:MAG: RNA polymerase sigma factor [Ruminococcus sp.]|nr:RNA polymerase sigma factor [Ruminococcus sp.]
MGNREFEELYNSTKDAALRYITAKCHSLSDIDDIFQNVYLAVLEALDRGAAPIQEPEAFVIGTARRQLSKYYSLGAKLKMLVSIEHEPSYSGEITEESDLEDIVADRELIREISGMLREKPLTTQKVIFLHYSRGLSIKETAEALGMKESTVKRHIYSTLEELRRRYSANGRSEML